MPDEQQDMQADDALASLQPAMVGAIVPSKATLQQTMQPAAVVHPVSLLLSQERAQESDGLWAAKQFGDFEPGDVRIMLSLMSCKSNFSTSLLLLHTHTFPALYSGVKSRSL
jgi:hypothetical protein